MIQPPAARIPPAAVGGRVLAGVLETGGWLIVIGLLLVALARIVAWDSRTVLVGLNAATPALFLAAWPVAIIATALRRWALLAAAVLVVAAQITFGLPEILAAEPVPAAARSAPSFRIFSANVYAGNADVRGYADEILRSRPDIVVLQEATPALLATLDGTGSLEGLPHRITVTRGDPFAAAVASRWPLDDHDVVSTGDRPILIRATVHVGGQPIRIYAFHAVSPVAGYREQWIGDHDALRAAVQAERLPVVVAGDFNATWGHRVFRRLLDLGLTDAAAARGRAYEMTWPRARRVLPPFARIDHVLTTRPMVVTRIRTGVGRGSDHRPLVADVAVP